MWQPFIELTSPGDRDARLPTTEVLMVESGAPW